MEAQEKITKLINDALPSIAQAVKNELRESAVASASSRLQALILEEVTRWFNENMAPEIHEVLAGQKPALIAAVQVQSEQMVEALNETLTAAMKENLQSSWKRRKIFESLFE